MLEACSAGCDWFGRRGRSLCDGDMKRWNVNLSTYDANRIAAFESRDIEIWPYIRSVTRQVKFEASVWQLRMSLTRMPCIARVRQPALPVVRHSPARQDP